MIEMKELLRFQEILVDFKSFTELDRRSNKSKYERLRMSANDEVFKNAYQIQLEKLWM